MLKVSVPDLDAGIREADRRAMLTGNWCAVVEFDNGTFNVVDAVCMSILEDLDPPIHYEAEGTELTHRDERHCLSFVGNFPTYTDASLQFGAEVMKLAYEYGVKDPGIFGGPPAEVGAFLADQYVD